MRKINIYSFIAVLIAFTLNSCGSTMTEAESSEVEAGVSKKLADYRKEVISNLNYNVKFTIPDSIDMPIEAVETITLSLKKVERPLQIDFKEKTGQIKNIVVNGKNVKIDHRNEHIIIPQTELKEGENTIDIEFVAGDLSLNRNEDYLYTLLVPDRARTVFPVFDQPNLKATFDLTLTVPQGWQALSNAPLKDSLSIQDKTAYHFATSDKISTYLFSFAAGKFDKVTRVLDGVTMNFYHRETDEEKIRESLDPVFQIHADALNFLEDYTQIPYPFQKFDFIAIPGFQYGGMEHVGAIDYKASTLFLDKGATKNEKISRSSLIAHETAHMWFGDLVTMDWFDDVWTKEVFANFMADKITLVALEGMNYDLKFLLSHFPSAYNVDRTAGANPIRQRLENLQDAGSMYGSIIYHKAPIMMRQLERMIGEKSFKEGLQEYLKKYAFENATWPDLIKILDKRTDIDLTEWNQVWVNEPGRPVFEYEVASSNGKITDFTITQRGEDNSDRLWPQIFEILLVYPNEIKEISVNMDQKQVVIDQLTGEEIPEFILFNSSGQGYGVFPVDKDMLQGLYQLQDPVHRASAYITLYENMLNGRYIEPAALIDFLREGLAKEEEELNLNRLTGYLSETYWKFISEEKRNYLTPVLEEDLWNAMQQNTSSNAKKVLFKTYQSIALTEDAQDKLYDIWKDQKAPEGVHLAEDDYTSLALSLAVRDFREGILNQQLERIKNPDRKKRLEFIMLALSSDEQVRDQFFASLKDPKNREKESWVGSALSYLHHPLRTDTSEKYLRESLEELEEIQVTGDIFFPYRWLQATFSSYRSDKAVEVVQDFLEENQDFNPKLRDKILQATDDVFRANKLVNQ